jgi:Branched-chain amino acid aminotransferase/4-amino-4-deoxychorismate lyase
VQGGDAVWEGLRLYNGRIFKLHEHLDRLERSARALSFEEIPPREKIIDEIKRTLAANKMRDGAHIRLTLTRGVKITSGMDPRLNQSGPTLIVLAEHKPRLCENGPEFDHEQDPPPAAGCARCAYSSCKPAELDPGKDRSEQCRARTMHSCSTRADSLLKRTRRTSSLCVTPMNREQAATWQQAAL